MFTNKLTLGLRFVLVILAGLSLLSPWPLNAVGLAQQDVGYIGEVRSLETNDLGLLNPAGLAFSPDANAFFALEAGTTTRANILTMTPYEEYVGSVTVSGSLIDPINMAFDEQAHRLLLLDTSAHQLIAVKVGPGGYLDPSPAAITRYGVGQLGLQNPRGMAVDPANGHLLILDSGALQIVRIEPDSQGSFDGASALNQGRISRVDLRQTGLVDPRGLAFNPSNGHLYLVSPSRQALYELTQTGQVVRTLDLSPFELLDPQGLVFAPSADLTDEPSIIHLYVADAGLSAGLGRVIEFSLTPPPTRFPAATDADVVATLVRTIDTRCTQTSAWCSILGPNTPPSPDPSGIAYVSSSGRLIISDGEVEEMSIWAGTNVWETDLSGSVVRTLTTWNGQNNPPQSFSDEPTGVAYDPPDNRLFFTDDTSGSWVFEKGPGPDEILWTMDDTVASFQTSNFGSGDPEGIAFGNGHLFIADGVNAEVYEVTLGGSLISHFDTAGLGLTDIESVEFNPDNGHLYILSDQAGKIGETATDGTLLRYIDIASLGTRAAAGLAYAPASNNSGQWNLYIVERGVDNGSNPKENDGKLYEISFPPWGSGNQANQSISVTTHAPANAAYDTSFTVAATASSGLPVVITTTGVCTGSGSGSASVKMTNGNGTCTVRYNQAGNANYYPAPEVTEDVKAQKADQTINVTMHAPASAAYNASFTVAATGGSSGNPIIYSASGACSNAGTSFTMTSGTGICKVKYNQAGTAIYTAAPEVTEDVNAEKADQTITIVTHAPASAAYGDSFTVAATGGDSGNPVTYSATGACSNVGAIFTMTSRLSSCTVHYNQGGDTDYDPAPEVTETVNARAGNIYLPFIAG